MWMSWLDTVLAYPGVLLHELNFSGIQIVGMTDLIDCLGFVLCFSRC